MRTTITLDDDVANKLRENAYRDSKSFKQVVNEALRAGLAPGSAKVIAKPFAFPTANMGRSVVDLTKALTLAAEIDDQVVRAKWLSNK